MIIDQGVKRLRLSFHIFAKHMVIHLRQMIHGKLRNHLTPTLRSEWHQTIMPVFGERILPAF
jgi:hypothetical protein